VKAYSFIDIFGVLMLCELQRQLEAVQSPVRGDSRAVEYDGDDGGENFAHIDLAEGGISENEPIVREDVIRATDPASDPLPPAKLARSLADKFETMSTASRGAVERAPSAGRKVGLYTVCIIYDFEVA
jgi:hypothetical protein